ncbi:MAG: beta strand repeat-containing protein, partial [Limisphaerales bacterium]
DNGSTSPTTILFTFGINQVGRGLRFAPVTDPPSITAPPASVTAVSGSTTSFSVTAGGTAPFSYQWRKAGVALTNGGNISGALTSSLTISGVSAGDVNSYSVVVANDISSTTSSDATLTLATADPAIAINPHDVSTVFGSAAIFSVTASGTSPFNYHWQKNGSNLSDGANISGSATANLTVSSAACTDVASYSVVVGNIHSTATSTSAVLSVADPIITTQPTAAYAIDGNNAIFTVGTAGTGPLGYQWQKNGGTLSDGGNITGSTTASLTVATISSADLGSYNVIVSGGCGSNIVSTAAPLVESSAVAISFAPQPRTVHAGDKTSFVVAATGTSPYLYQWSFNGGTIAGATNSFLLVPQAQSTNAGTYSVTVSNLAGTFASASATLTVSQNPINLYPTNIVILRTGDGSGPLATSGNSLFLDQFATNGQYLNTISIPDSGPSALIGFNGVTDNYLSRSANNAALMIGGFNVPKPFSASLNTSVATAVPRGIAVVNAAGSYSLAISDTNSLYDSLILKTATSLDGVSQFWTIGPAGVIYTALGGPDVLVTNSPSGRSVTAIFNNDLYTSQTGGLYHYNGLPTVPSAATKLFTSSNPNDFAISPDGLTIYVTDGSNITSGGGGVQRWDNNSGTWTLSYTYSTPPFIGSGNNGPDGLTVDFSNFAGGGAGNFGAVIYATSGQGTQNSLFQIIDTDGSETPTIVYTFGPNQVGRGIRFGPSVLSLSPQLTISISGSNVTISWPDTATGYTLESTPSLPATWTATGLPVTGTNGRNVVTDQVSSTQKYYRLHK